MSQFGALATALAATIGTGNIVGVATAVALGGPGAVLWCWLTGVVIVGGVNSIAKVCEWVVPIMALLYIVGCGYVLWHHADYVIPAIEKICSSAFSPPKRWVVAS